MEKYICIHGHFYQPPRENAWLESVELQDSAYPYHDWNERITAESYGPNSVSRLLDDRGRIASITNNYARISFDFGPTLMAWMEHNADEVYQRVIKADIESRELSSGHGSAMAQAYNHMIMPLANRRDKQTQVMWGIRDFVRRFGREPEGMWLPETAVDIETLEIMAEAGIRYSVLAPHQASHSRQLGQTKWQDVKGGKIDPTTTYLLLLPSGRNISLFFYDGPISRAVAFEHLLDSGEALCNRLMSAFHDKRTWPQLVHIATDGETYGHHHPHGDMALAYALKCASSKHNVNVTNYGEYLAKHPPVWEVQLIENTSWSCAHGIERWRSDCGCNSGMHPGWNQAWRAAIRKGLDWLRDTMAAKYEEKAATLLKDPWAARNDYIEVILDRSVESLDAYFSKHALRELNSDETVTVLKLLELQRYAMLMYTSCGWFFDELSGIETVQVIQYAGRVVQLGQELFGDSIEERFLQHLAEAKSNIPEHRDGRLIYEKFVKPAMVDLARVTAHYAVSSLFEKYEESQRIKCYVLEQEDRQTYEAGITRMSLGRLKVTSAITRESSTITFGTLHFGDHNLNAGVRYYQGPEAYEMMAREMKEAFFIADLPGIIRLMDKHFGGSSYSLRSLFRDEQRKVLGYILETTLTEFESMSRQRYDRYYSLMRFLNDMGQPLPRAFRAVAEFTLNAELRRSLGEHVDVDATKALLIEANRWGIALDGAGLGYVFKQALEDMMGRFVSNTEDLPLLNELVAAVSLSHPIPFKVDLWRVQNVYYEMLNSKYPDYRERGSLGDIFAKEWVSAFTKLGEELSMAVDQHL
jgi:alpha-amylase/alpha-mannosidase (GH57 family)